MTIPGALVAPSVAAALDAARGDALRRGVDEISVVGGADIYAQTIADADRLVITRVKLQPAGDTTFPPIDPKVWREVERTDHAAGPDDEAAYSIHVYERRTSVDRPKSLTDRITMPCAEEPHDCKARCNRPVPPL